MSPGRPWTGRLDSHRRHLSLELGRGAAILGLPRDCRLYLDMDDDTIRRVRAALLEILQCACFIVDTAEGRTVS